MQRNLQKWMLAAVMFLSVASYAQNTLTVANGTLTNSYVPVYGLYIDYYVRCQTVYPATMLTETGEMTGETILGLTYYLSSPASQSWGNAVFVVNIMEVSETSLSSFVDMTAATTVYTGPLDATQSTMEIEFTNPYLYQGGNLLVEIYNTAFGTFKTAYFYGVSATDASWQGYNATNVANITGSSRDFIPKTTFTYGTPPTCFKVTEAAVDAAQTTSNSLTLTWFDDLNTGATYNVYDMSDTSLVWSGTDYTCTIGNLDAYTEYTFGIETDCGGGDIANGYMFVSGLTNCGEEGLPFAEDFSVSLSNNPCWRGATGITADEVLAGAALTLTDNNQWTYSSSVSNGLEAGHYRVNIYGSSCKKWMITPNIDLSSAVSPILSFDAAFTDYYSSNVSPASGFENNPTQAFMILVSTDNGQTWTTASNINLSDIASTTYLTQYVNLGSYAGETVRIAFYAQSTQSGGDNNLHIDNILIDENSGGLCLPVNNLTVSDIAAHGTTLTWYGDADSYTIYNMSDTSFYQYVTDTYADIYNLTPETQYTFGVVANCGDDESPVVTVTFTTLISCPAPTDLAYSLTPGDGTVATLSWNENGDAYVWQICLDGDENNLIDVYDNTYDLTNLIPETTYTAKVRAYCDEDDQSVWSNTVTFTPTYNYQLTVNDGSTTNNYVPVYGLFADELTRSQFIIPAASLAPMQSGMINKLTFYASQANVYWGAASFQVYLTETTETTLSALVDYNAMTQVYDGTLSISGNQMVVSLNTPYIYLGGNLMVGFKQTVEGSYASSSWYGVSATGTSMGGYANSILQRNFLPKTTIDYIPGDESGCFPVTALTVGNVTDNSVSLSWSEENNSGATYTIYDMADNSVLASGVATTNYEVTGLIGGTTYTFGVQAICSADDNSTLATVTVSTTSVTQYTVTLNTADATMGSVDPAGTHTIDGGSSFTATANPNPNYHFVAWMNGTAQVSTANPYIFTVTGNIALTATFDYNDGIEDFEFSNINVYSSKNTIIVQGAENQDISVYDVAGHCIYQHAGANETERINVLAAGTYLVRINNGITKKVVVLK